MKKSYRQVQKRTNMAGEKLLSLIERDIGISALIMITGLLYSRNGMWRGFPVPWLCEGRANGIYFVLSLILIFAAVLIMDLITLAVKSGSEPNADKQSRQASVIVNDFTNDYEGSSYTAGYSADVKANAGSVPGRPYSRLKNAGKKNPLSDLFSDNEAAAPAEKAGSRSARKSGDIRSTDLSNVKGSLLPRERKSDKKKGLPGAVIWLIIIFMFSIFGSIGTMCNAIFDDSYYEEEYEEPGYEYEDEDWSNENLVISDVMMVK